MMVMKADLSFSANQMAKVSHVYNLTLAVQPEWKPIIAKKHV
jgi:hypothetical protein